MTVEIFIQSPRAPSGRSARLAPRRKTGRAALTAVDVRSIRLLLQEVCERMDIADGAWTIRILSNAKMRRLHRQFLDIDTSTDVLTFDLSHSLHPPHPSDGKLLLDTAIGIDVAARQSRSRAVPIRHEVLLYAIHSLLHVQGYNDRTPAAAKRMHGREDALLTELGIGPVYHANPVGGARR